MMPADPPVARPDFIDHDTWFAQLPGVVVAAGALITDPAGRVLLVKPNYRDYWTLPGGICEHGEPPHAGCAREVAEEIGLALPVGGLLAIDWSQPYGPDARPTMHFVFDGGALDDGSGIVLQREELDDFRFTDPGEVSGYMAPYGVRRVAAALAGRASGAAVYQPTLRT
jgi:8-oxo-dGTP diphosphatase